MMLKKLPIVLLLLSLILGACGNTGASTSNSETPPEQPAQTQETAIEPATTSTTEPITEPTNTPTPTTETTTGVSNEVPAATETPAPAPTEESASLGGVRTFVIVPEESQASYIVAEEFFGGALNQLGIQPGLVDTIGSTQQIEGELQLDLDNLAAPLIAGTFTVNLESLTSDQSRRDRRIRNSDLESSRYPLAVFVAAAIENGPTSYTEGETVTFQVVGDMTIRDITQPVTMDVTAVLNGDTITGVAIIPLRMTDFGFNPPNIGGLFAVADEFRAEVQFTMLAK